MIKKCHYDVILWGGFGSTKCDPNLTSHLRRFFAGKVSVCTASTNDEIIFRWLSQCKIHVNYMLVAQILQLY